MNSISTAVDIHDKRKWRSYYDLCKPRVVMLMLLTAIVGMCLASPHWPNLFLLIVGSIGIALSAASAAAFNHIADQHIDKLMKRTARRPLVQGELTVKQCFLFAMLMGLSGLTLLYGWVNPLTALLTFISLIGYAVCYTLFLKYQTPQNIVIGGLAGAAPPLLGWTAMTGHIAPEALLLVLIVFVWTPPHFWALAIHRFDDYAKAQVPMLPNTHGIRYTKLQILLYSLLLCAVTLLPFVINETGLVYLCLASLFNARFLYWVWKLFRSETNIEAIKLFKFSITYLGGIFLVLLLDHYL
jgi:protoheme IX farnesyltransferase